MRAGAILPALARLARAAVLAVCAVSLPALAQTSPRTTDPVAGDWRFETSTFQGDCMIKGVMTFRPTGIAGSYSCVFQSEQICGKQNTNMYIRVDQSCTAQKVGQQVAVKSAVTRILEAKDDLGPFRSGYLADNFVVTLQKSRTEMLGDHYDEQRELKARFWRDTGDLVS